MIYLKLLWAYLQIGLFGIGGGYAALPMVSQIIVDQRAWLSLREFADMVTISIMAPGIFTLNTAAFVGFKVGGIFGGVVSTIACILPGFVIILIYSYLYKKYNNLPAVNGALFGIRPAVTGLVASAGLYILFLSVFNTREFSQIQSVDIISVFIVIISFVFLKWKKLNPILVIFIAGFIGVFAYSII